MDEPRKTVKLKNGSEEFGPLVAVTTMSLRSLYDSGGMQGPLAVYELHQICKDSSHKPFGNYGDELKRLSLATEQDGKWHVHDSIRNIVLSSIEGDGLEMKLVDPVAA